MLLGLDPALTTGYALWTPERIVAGSFTASGRTSGAKMASLSRELNAILQSHPDITMAALEAPLPPMLSRKVIRRDMMGTYEAKEGITTMKNTLTSYGIRGCFLATLDSLHIPTFNVTVQRWRRGFFGKGVRGRDRDEWKRMAAEYAGHLGVKVPNHDAAEAVGVVSWLAANQHMDTELGQQLAGPLKFREKEANHAATG